jgi:hypothetical protein
MINWPVTVTTRNNECPDLKLRGPVFKRERKHGEEGRINKIYFIFVKHDGRTISRSIPEGTCTQGAKFVYSCVIKNFRKFIRHDGRQGIGNIGVSDIVGMDNGDQVQLVFIGMKFVVTLFILYPKHNKNKTGHSHRQPRDIDKRKQFMPPNIA